jgi:2',3'-cyclic-nucleotide 2'-phosphodiesterase/3'-nucleotidase
LLMTGAELADWLERAATVFNRIEPGATAAPLLNADIPGFAFETIPQLSYAIDLSQPARYDAQGFLVNPDARRITGLSYENRPVRDGDEFLLATSTHRAGRARLQGTRADLNVVFTDGARVQSVIASHLQGRGPVTGQFRRNWHFLPMPGTSVTLAAGDGADLHLADIEAFRPVVLGKGFDGFNHYQLHL